MLKEVLDTSEKQVDEASKNERERYAKIVDSFDTAQWSDTQRNVVRIVAYKIREG